MGLLKVAKKARAAAAARQGECVVCGKTIRGGAKKANVCSTACSQFIGMSW
jgi:hypothetical protein